MLTPFRQRCCALSLGLLLLLVLWAGITSSTRLALDFGDLTTFEQQPTAANRKMEQINERLMTVRRSIALKERIIKDLMAQRLTLFEAAAHYETASATPLILSDCSGACHEERLCRRIIDSVCLERFREPDLTAWLACVLEDELRACLRSQGTVYLPPPDPMYLLQIYQEVLPFGMGDELFQGLREAESAEEVSPPQ